MISFLQYKLHSCDAKKCLALICITLFALVPTHLYADTNRPSLPTQFQITPDSEKFEFKKSSFSFDSAQSENATTEKKRFAEKYFRMGLGLGKGRSAISLDEQNIYINDSGIAFGLRLALERPLMSMLSVHAAWDTLIVSHPRLFENSTASIGSLYRLDFLLDDEMHLKIIM